VCIRVGAGVGKMDEWVDEGVSASVSVCIIVFWACVYMIYISNLYYVCQIYVSINIMYVLYI